MLAIYFKSLEKIDDYFDIGNKMIMLERLVVTFITRNFINLKNIKKK